jgi:hypothetical protein
MPRELGELSTHTAMQFSLQTPRAPIPHRQAISSDPEDVTDNTYVCSCGVRPMENLQYEHMFSSTHRPQHQRPLLRRLPSALLSIRSFLLLEDDYDVDWEVDRDEQGELVGPDTNGHASVALRSELGGSEGNRHPHRMALQSRLGDRRPGVVAGRELVCVCPLPLREPRVGEVGQRGSRMSTGIVRVAIDL